MFMRAPLQAARARASGGQRGRSQILREFDRLTLRVNMVVLELPLFIVGREAKSCKPAQFRHELRPECAPIVVDERLC